MNANELYEEDISRIQPAEDASLLGLLEHTNEVNNHTIENILEDTRSIEEEVEWTECESFIKNEFAERKAKPKYSGFKAMFDETTLESEYRKDTRVTRERVEYILNLEKACDQTLNDLKEIINSSFMITKLSFSFSSYLSFL
jgi:hypothetical protein